MAGSGDMLTMIARALPALQVSCIVLDLLVASAYSCAFTTAVGPGQLLDHLWFNILCGYNFTQLAVSVLCQLLSPKCYARSLSRTNYGISLLLY
jgi:hypothetical protein